MRRAFEALAMKAFRYQSAENDVYGRFIKALGVDAASVDSIHKNTFSAHKPFQIDESRNRRFHPAGSVHLKRYDRHGAKPSLCEVPRIVPAQFLHIVGTHYGPVEDYAVLALLPSYLEREGSSLIVMADGFIKRSRHPESGFFPVPARRAARQT